MVYPNFKDKHLGEALLVLKVLLI